jgi:predicted dehydrogenase
MFFNSANHLCFCRPFNRSESQTGEHMKPLSFVTAIVALSLVTPVMAADLRIGMIGLDTSHSVAFTEILNDPNHPQHVPGGRVVVAFKGGSPDLQASAGRVEKFTKELRDRFHVQVVDNIAAMCQQVDAVLLESVDGRVHLAQVKEVMRAHKPVFIDKPLAASLADARQIDQLGRETGTPWFSSSSLRFAPEYEGIRTDSSLGAIFGVESYGSAHLEPTNPGLFWYGIHAVEALFTVMGTGCQSVSSVSTPDYDMVVGTWNDGRIGTVRGLRKGKEDYGLLIFGEKAVRHLPLADVSYVPLVRQILQFFRTNQPPVLNSETLEIMAFMDAAERSRQQNGGSIRLSN